MATTTRSLRDEVANLLDYLLQNQLAVFINPVSITYGQVSWHSLRPDQRFLIDHGSTTVKTYLHWASMGAYSAILLDGALLQITYEVSDGDISSHRLAYVPCPYEIDRSLLNSESIEDIIEVYTDAEPLGGLLHSVVRFDYDPDAAAPGHPAAHMTINVPGCRIACASPMHIGRFANFVFKNFYGPEWQVHRTYFEAGAYRHVGARVISDDDLRSPHMHWSR